MDWLTVHVHRKCGAWEQECAVLYLEWTWNVRVGVPSGVMSHLVFVRLTTSYQTWEVPASWISCSVTRCLERHSSGPC